MSADWTEDDVRWMRRAVDLAAIARHETRPNPPVGCVLVKGGELIGEGFHRRAGEPHAEIEALRSSDTETTGATAYVTLEPCNHQGRTGPCSEALVEAGVARVVVGAQDPNPRASGGIERLRAAGVEVTVGVLRRECEAVAEVFMTNIAKNRAHLRLKLASSLDGKTAASDGTSRWITDRQAREAVHALRAEVDAVMVGSGTILADDPQLSARHVHCERQPTRVVLDRRLRVSTQHRVTHCDAQRTILCTTASNRATAQRRFDQSPIEIVALGDGGSGWLLDVFRELYRRDIRAILCEAGATLAAALLRARLVDRLDVMFGPKLLGSGRPLLAGLGIDTIEDALDVRIDRVTALGQGAWLSGTIASE